MPALTQPEAQTRAALVAATSYEVSLDLTTPAVLSRTVIRFRCDSPGVATFADLRVPRVLSATLNGREVGPPGEGRLALPGLAAQNVLTVEAELSPQALSTFTDPADGAAYTLAFAYPTSAPELFCCFDQPGMPAPLTLTLRAPSGWECVANGTVVSRPSPGAAGDWRFAPLRLNPMDFTFCAGPFTAAPLPGARVPAAVRGRAALPEDTARYLGRFAELARLAFDRYERDLRLPYPYAKYDIVALPQLQAHAACFPGLMIVNEDLLRRLANPDDDDASMIAEHEAAHWWFGGLVCTSWWDDLWLEESMATYVTYTSDAGWASFAWSEKPRAYRADELPTAQPVSSQVETMAQARDRPNAITYVKGTAIVRQLAALIGEPAVTAGLTDYLTRHGTRGHASLDDLVASWSRVSGRDLSDWAQAWLRTPGTPVLRAELAEAPGGTIASLLVIADRPWPQRVSVGLYDRDTVSPGTAQAVSPSATRLRRRRSATVELSGHDCVVGELAGEPVPDAVIVNDRDWSFAHVVLDHRSLAAVVDVAMDVGDPLTEVTCWNALWHIVLTGEFAAADFATLVARRVRAATSAGCLSPAAAESLLARAATCADRYVPASMRAGIREMIADAALAGMRSPATDFALARILQASFAASAEAMVQLALLRDWLDGPESADLTVRGAILRTLSALGLASDADLDTLTAADPVAGETLRATCAATRPDQAAKEAAWTAALAPKPDARLARANAEGIWVAGQENLMAGFRDRYFTEALPALVARDARGERLARRLARLLFPSTLHDETTLAALTVALGNREISGYIRGVLQEEEAELRTAVVARRARREARLASWVPSGGS